MTAGVDGTARIWDSSTGAELLTLRANCGAFSPDGKAIAGGNTRNSIVLWETSEPKWGYEARQTTIAARKIVDELHEELSLYSEVIKKLKADETLDEQVRKVAIQIANSRKYEDAEKTE